MLHIQWQRRHMRTSRNSRHTHGICEMASLQERLFAAVDAGDVERVAAALGAGADVNACPKYSKTALAKAAQKGHVEVARLLLDAGVDVNATDIDGRTALTWAASCGLVEVARVLLEAGADVNAKAKYVGTALIEAAWKGHAEVVRALLGAGADVDAKTNHGTTALMHASRRGHVDVARVLLVAGADDDGAQLARLQWAVAQPCLPSGRGASGRRSWRCATTCSHNRHNANSNDTVTTGNCAFTSIASVVPFKVGVGGSGWRRAFSPHWAARRGAGRQC
jgi:hypothetical protein